MSEVRVYPDKNYLAIALAELIIQQGAAAIASQGTFSLVLSGGTTPRAAFSLLAEKNYRNRLAWAKTFVFWGDERCVPPEFPESNYGMARRAFLDEVPLPAEHIFRMQGEITPTIAAEVYEGQLRAYFSRMRAVNGLEKTFDLVLLGLGDDGHTASLFPETPALDEKQRWVVANYVPRLDDWRLTLTYPVINAAGCVVFLVSGSGKAEILRKVLLAEQNGKPTGSSPLPAERIRPETGQLLWLADEAAAALL
jgi:6-phosphogluconolactonase